MAFKKGQSGNPGGRSTEQAFTHVLRAELNQKASGERLRLQNVVKALVAKAESGDVGAIREIADRLEGRALQQIENNVTQTSYVVKVPHVAETKEEWLQRYAPSDKLRGNLNGDRNPH